MCLLLKASVAPPMRMCAPVRGLFLALVVVLRTVVAFAPVPRITWEHGGECESLDCQQLQRVWGPCFGCSVGSVRAGLSCWNVGGMLCEQEALVATSGPQQVPGFS